MAADEGPETGRPPIGGPLAAGQKQLIHGWGRWVRRLDLPFGNRVRPLDEPPRYESIDVERYDSLATVCGKLDSTRLSQIVVLAPRGNVELSRAIGMRLLMRHAELTGKDIVVVGGGLSIRQRARAEGQAYARNERSVRFGGEPRRALQLGGLDLGFPSVSTAVTILGSLVIGVLGFIALFWYLPVATVALYPPTAPVDAQHGLTLDSQSNHVDASAFVIPGVRRQLSTSRTIFVLATGSPPDASADSDASGGLPDAQHTVSDADSKAAAALGPAALREQALLDFQSRYGASQVFFPETAQVQVLHVDQRQQVGDAADFVEVTYDGSVSMLGAQKEDLRGLFVGLLRQDLPRDRQILDSSILLEPVKSGPFDADADRLPIQMKASARTTQAVDAGRLKAGLEGKSVRDAVEVISGQVDAVKKPDLRLTPSWVPWLPHTAGHIHLDIRTD